MLAIGCPLELERKNRFCFSVQRYAIKSPCSKFPNPAYLTGLMTLLPPPGFVLGSPPFMAASMLGAPGLVTPGLRNTMTGLPYQVTNPSFGMSPPFVSPPALSRAPSTTPISAADAQEYADNLSISVIGQELRAILTQKIWPFHWMHDTIAQQLDMLAAVEAGGLKPIIDSSYPLEQLADAFRHQESQQHFGKICLDIGG